MKLLHDVFRSVAVEPLEGRRRALVNLAPRFHEHALVRNLLDEQVREPHSSQNLALARSAVPQLGHSRGSSAPQFSQNFAPVRFSCWQAGQNHNAMLSPRVRHARLPGLTCGPAADRVHADAR